MVPYVGNALYCFANSTAMLLASAGEAVPPSRIEVLTGVGLGAFWMEDAGLLFFSNTPPDVGISQALGLLGFEATERSRPGPEPTPFEELRADLAKSPVALGPLDMGYLDYIPYHETVAGADHYVLAFAMDESQVYLHDPVGYPHVALPLDRLGLAWKAERIGYRRGHYRCWTYPRRVRQPAPEEVYDGAMQYFMGCYRYMEDQAARGNWLLGSQAILACARHVRDGALSPQEEGHMTSFAFQLGAVRALDFAAFFDYRDPKLSALKRSQAELFGRGHTMAVRKDWPSLAAALEQLAEVEEGFRTTLMKMG
jgi:hypothetical protein